MGTVEESKKIVSAARAYEKNLCWRDLLIYSENRTSTKSGITVVEPMVIQACFAPEAFAHLVGIKASKPHCESSRELYRKAVSGTIRGKDYLFTHIAGRSSTSR